MRHVPHGSPPPDPQVAISDAIADVAVAARRVAVERTELLRLELRNDIRGLISGVVLYGAIAVVLMGVGLLLAAIALFQALSAWLGLLAAAVLVVVPFLGGSVAAGLLARRHLPERILDDPDAEALDAEAHPPEDVAVEPERKLAVLAPASCDDEPDA